MLLNRRGFTLVELIVVMAIIGILTAILLPVFGRTHCNERRSSCLSDLKQLGFGFRQYTQDYNDKFPLSKASSKVGWTISLHPYFKTWEVYHCPSSQGKRQRTLTDYFYNSRLSGLSGMKLDVSSRTIAFGDGKANSPPSYAISQLPLNWIEDAKSPSYRHVDGANYLFADGHVKWLTPDKVTLEKPTDSGSPTFLPR